MKNNFLKAIFFIVFFLIFGVNAKAMVTKCVYGTGRVGSIYGSENVGIVVTIDEDDNLSYKKIGNDVNSVNIKELIMYRYQFTDRFGNTYCPSEVKYKRNYDSNIVEVEMAFNPPSNNNYYNLSLKLNDDLSFYESREGLIRVCTYGNYIVSLYEDKSLKGYMDGYTVVVNANYSEFETSCPAQIYVSSNNVMGVANVSTKSIASAQQINLGKEVYKGEELDCNSIVSPAFQDFLQKMLNLAKYLGPILVAVFTIVDLVKAALSGDAGEMKKVYQKLLKRLIAAALLFFIPLIINTIFDLVGIFGPNVCSNFE